MKPRQQFNRLSTLGIAALTIFLVSCGGGGSGGSSSSGSMASSGTSTTMGATPASASGVISAFGSVIVNGTEYAVDSSTSVVDGDSDDAPSTASALQVGMTVDVTASATAATKVRFTSAVRGEVDAVDANQSTLTVLGQTVVITSGTSFAGTTTSSGAATAVTSISNINVGDYVVVYGFIECTSTTSSSTCSGGATQVVASLVYEPGTAGGYRTVGYAENVTASADTFTINGLTVSYTTSGTSATSCTPSPCAITAGEFVEVRSTTVPSSSNGALTLAATRIKQSAFAPVLESGETVSIQGPVNNLSTTADTFTVRGVSIDGSTLASTVGTLSDGQIVEVTGTVNADGSIAATAITVEHFATFALVAPLTAESATGDTISLLGQTFTVNGMTKFADRASHQSAQPFNLSNFTSVLSVGDFVEVSGYSGSSGFVATRVELLPTPKTAFVAAEGVVTAVSTSADTLTIGGVTISLDAATKLLYPKSGGSGSISAFLAAITTGSSIVGVAGTQGSSTGTITADYALLANPNCGWARGGL
jgi:hypothetical protein